MFLNKKNYLESLVGRQVQIYGVNGVRIWGELLEVLDGDELIISRDNVKQLVQIHNGFTIYPIVEEG